MADLNVGTGAIATAGSLTGTEILVCLQGGAAKELVLSRMLYGDANNQMRIAANSGVIANNDGHYFALGAEFYSGSWRNTVTGQGGAALRNSAGTLAIYTGTSPGAAGSAFSNFAQRWFIDGNGNITQTGSHAFSGAYSSTFHMDVTPAAQSVVNGGVIDIGSFSGLIVITNHNNGSTGLYIVGAGLVNTVAVTAAVECTVTYVAGVGYRITNTSGGTRVYGVALIRTRQTP